MSIFVEQLQRCALSFDDQKFPLDAYFSLLDEVAQADTPERLASALEKLLAWKDGKIRRNFFRHGPDNGQFIDRFSVSQTRPNTCSARHVAVMKSGEFFKWAQSIRRHDVFDADALLALGPQGFNLWKSTVIPGFVLHTLQPRCYAIVDQWVVLAQVLMDPDCQASPRKLDTAAYVDYHAFWRKTLQEAGVDAATAPLAEIKRIDAGLWVFGKTAQERITRVVGLEEADEDGESSRAGAALVNSPVALGQDETVRTAAIAAFTPAEGVSTDSAEFKQKAISLHVQNKMSQGAAIEAAARHFGIDLRDKPSYQKYPGSHFDRWRKQGYMK